MLFGNGLSFHFLDVAMGITAHKASVDEAFGVQGVIATLMNSCLLGDVVLGGSPLG